MSDHKKLTDEALVKLHVPGIRIVKERPAGYREFEDILEVSERAVKFRYYSWVLWAPKKSIVQIKGTREFWVSAWAVDTAKNSRYAKRVYE